jgi:hypothetical protein
MYAVVRYHNYRKEQDLKVLNVFYDKEKAIKKAYEYAEEEFKVELQEEKLVDHVKEQWLFLYDAITEYTIGDGFGAYVFAVITLPQPE